MVMRQLQEGFCDKYSNIMNIKRSFVSKDALWDIIHLAKRIVQLHSLKERSKLVKVDLLGHLRVLDASVVASLGEVESRKHRGLAVEVVAGLAHLHTNKETQPRAADVEVISKLQRGVSGGWIRQTEMKTADNNIWLLNMNKAKDPTVATPFSRSETSRLSLSEMLNSSHTSLWRKWECYWQWW